MQEWTSALSSCRADQKTYMDCLAWDPDELIMNSEVVCPKPMEVSLADFGRSE
jgi:hypothetical protein